LDWTPNDRSKSRLTLVGERSRSTCKAKESVRRYAPRCGSPVDLKLMGLIVDGLGFIRDSTINEFDPET
jgi:hypothetical protein